VQTVRQYEVVGRLKPTLANPKPMIYRMKIFAPNQVVARSRFWYFLSNLQKAKRQTGEILSTKQIYESSPTRVKNFAIVLRYDSRSGTHNMYKEVRAMSTTEAVDKMYSEMASRHRARFRSIQIITVKEIPAKECRRPNVVQFHNSRIQFRLLHRVPRASSKAFKKAFSAVKPSSFF
jgi:large subunit ribosomal protein L18Ae